MSARTLALATIGSCFVLAGERIGFASGNERRPLAVQQLCKFTSATSLVGPVVVADLPSGVSSDGRGPYATEVGSVLMDVGPREGVGLSILRPPRSLTLNLTHPVAGGGGIPRGMVTDSNVRAVRGELVLQTQWKMAGDTLQSPLGIRVGDTVKAGQIAVLFHIDGRSHILQMGPQPYGTCRGAGLLHGAGTSQGTIQRPNFGTWVVDLPAGSVGRLFDVSNGRNRATDLGTYFVELHYEVVNAVPPVAEVLQGMAREERAPAIIARYRVLRRDSARAYFFNEQQLDAVGFWLFGNKRFSEAMSIFQVNLEESPQSSNTYEALGESFLELGDTLQAIARLRRSLELNAKNQDAINVLSRLGVKP